LDGGVDDAARRGKENGQRRFRRCLWQSGRHRRRYACDAAFGPARTDGPFRAGEDRAGPDETREAIAMDAYLARPHPSRPRDLRCPKTEVFPVHGRVLLPFGRDEGQCVNTLRTGRLFVRPLSLYRSLFSDPVYGCASHLCDRPFSTNWCPFFSPDRTRSSFHLYLVYLRSHRRVARPRLLRRRGPRTLFQCDVLPVFAYSCNLIYLLVP